MAFSRPNRTVPALTPGFTVATASAQDVGYNAMPGADFNKYKTYKWVEIEGTQYPDQIADAQIKSAISTQTRSPRSARRSSIKR